MGYGTGKKDMPTVNLGIAMAGKMSGGGVNLAPKKENTGGGMDPSQEKMMAGGDSPNKSGKFHSGSFPKGGFMKHSKSYSPTKGQGYNDREDESLGMKDGKESGKEQSDKDRRDESRGENKAQGDSPDGFARYDEAPKKYDEPMKLIGDQKKLIKKVPKLAKAIDDTTGGGGITKHGGHKKMKK